MDDLDRKILRRLGLLGGRRFQPQDWALEIVLDYVRPVFAELGQVPQAMFMITWTRDTLSFDVHSHSLACEGVNHPWKGSTVHRPGDDAGQRARLRHNAISKIDRWLFLERLRTCRRDHGGEGDLPAWALHCSAFLNPFIERHGIDPEAIGTEGLHTNVGADADLNVPSAPPFSVFTMNDRVDHVSINLSEEVTITHSVTSPRIYLKVKGMHLPQTVVSSIVGRPIGEVVEHPILTDGRMRVTAVTQLMKHSGINVTAAWDVLGRLPEMKRPGA